MCIVAACGSSSETTRAFSVSRMEFLCLFCVNSIFDFLMNSCFCCVMFNFLLSGQEIAIGMEECLQNDPFERDMKPYQSQSIDRSVWLVLLSCARWITTMKSTVSKDRLCTACLMISTCAVAVCRSMLVFLAHTSLPRSPTSATTYFVLISSLTGD